MCMLLVVVTFVVCTASQNSTGNENGQWSGWLAMAFLASRLALRCMIIIRTDAPTPMSNIHVRMHPFVCYTVSSALSCLMYIVHLSDTQVVRLRYSADGALSHIYSQHFDSDLLQSVC